MYTRILNSNRQLEWLNPYLVFNLTTLTFPAHTDRHTLLEPAVLTTKTVAMCDVTHTS